MPTKFNKQNRGFTEGYPLFLGKELGVVDTINVQYPELEKIYEDQVAYLWNPFEVDLTQDKLDMQNLPKDTVDLMVKTIMWQYAADSIASRSIIQTLGKYVSNSELENWFMIQSFFEVIHAKTYSHIIKQTFQFPNEMLEELYNDAAIMQRSQIITDTFDELEAVTEQTPRKEVVRLILRALVALFGLESIAFMSSFAVTFGITETEVFAGIGQDVTLICRDEVLHSKGGFLILQILKKDPEFGPALKEYTKELQELLDEITNQELTWANYLFSEGRSVIGLNARLLKDYSLFMAKPVYDVVGCEYTYKVVEENPLKYTEKFIDTASIQVAPQELNLVAYQVNAIVDDSADLDLDDIENLF